MEEQYTTIKLRRDIKTNWESKNPVLAEGEVSLISDSTIGEYKVGDGKTNWKTLPMLNGGIGKLDTTPDVANHGEVFNDYANNKATGEHSHAEGILTVASNSGAHAEGGIYSTKSNKYIPGGTASGQGAHAEGLQTIASGQCTHTEGWQTTASGHRAHAEGRNTTASAANSHAEGYGTTASASAANSHAEGDSTTASGIDSHAEGWLTTASGIASHAEGRQITASGNSSHAEGIGQQNIYLKGPAGATEYEICAGLFKNAARASLLQWKIKNAVKIEYYDGHDEANIVSARCDGDVVYVTLDKTLDANNAIDDTSTPCNKYLLHAAKGDSSHVEGAGCITVGDGAHAEGDNNSALDSGAHAEGILTVAKNHSAHSEGYSSFAEGNGAHAEGGIYSGSDNGVHCGGHAKGDTSHAEGIATISENFAQHVQGQFNTKEQTPSPTAYDATKTTFSIGNGTSDTDRSDALKMLGNGTTWIGGIGDFNGKNPTETNSLQAVLNKHDAEIKENAEVTARALIELDEKATCPQTGGIYARQNNEWIEILGVTPAPVGIRILHTNGKLFKESDWDQSWNSEAVGVYVGDDKGHRFIVAKTNTTPDKPQWGGYGTLIDGITTTTDENTAKQDWNGKDNTDKIVAQLGDGEQGGNYAARLCKLYAFPGRWSGKGYLGSVAEWMLVYQNKDEINKCLLKCGGTQIDTNWTSTQYNSTTAWVLYWANGDLDSYYKNYTYTCARAFAAFEI